MNKIVLVFIILFGLIINAGQAQTVRTISTKYLVFIASFQNTWDKTKDSTRAQFGGNNKLLNSYLIDVFKGIRGYVPNDMNKTAELTFKIDTLGKVDSVIFVKSFKNPKLDNTIKTIIESLSGKWRAGKINGKRVAEYNRIWIHFYYDNKIKNKTLDEFIADAEEQMKNDQYAEALKSLEKALEYDELNIKSITLKGICLLKTSQKEKACQLWNLSSKYETLEVKNLLKENCEERAQY